MGAYEDRTRQFDWLFIGVRGSILGRETREGNTRPEIVVCGRRYVNETTTRCDGSGWIEDVPPYGEREKKKKRKISFQIQSSFGKTSLPSFTFAPSLFRQCLSIFSISIFKRTFERFHTDIVFRFFLVSLSRAKIFRKGVGIRIVIWKESIKLAVSHVRTRRRNCNLLSREASSRSRNF